MTKHADRRAERLVERVEEGTELSGPDQEALLAFNDRLVLLGSQYGDERREKLLRHCVRMGENVGGLADALEDREAAEEIVRWIHRSYDNEESNRDYRVALRMFGEHVSEGDGKPDSISWVSATTSKNYNPMPDPSQMLHWDEEVQAMLDHSRFPRDKALITVAWDSGARSGEIRGLTVGDITDHKHGLQITVDGKKGQRSITLIPSVPYLRQWLNVHPASDDPDAPLWCKLDTAEDVSYQMKLKMLKKPAKKAGIAPERATFTNMRKSSASYLASQGVNQAHLEDHHGWERGSDVASRYVAVFGEANDREIAAAHGVEVEDEEPDPIAPVECPRCQRDTPRDEELCVWCGQAVEPTAIETVNEEQEEARRALLRVAKEDPELLGKIERMQDTMALVDDNPQLLGEARGFIEALSDD